MEFFCAKNIFSSHLAKIATSSANPVSSTTTAAKGKTKTESPPPLKQSARNLSLGYTEIEKWMRALGQDLFCVICNWAV